jgi:hypothetical protein
MFRTVLEQWEIDRLRDRAAEVRWLAFTLTDAATGIDQIMSTASAGLTPATWTGATARRRADELADALTSVVTAERELIDLADDLSMVATRMELQADEAQQLAALIAVTNPGG